MTLQQIAEKAAELRGSVCKLRDADREINKLRIFSPLERNWKRNVLYVAGERSYRLEEPQQNTDISVLFVGKYQNEFSEIKNLIILDNIKENEDFLWQISKMLTRDFTWILKQMDILTKAIKENVVRQSFLDCASDVMGNPLILLDNNFKILEVSLGSLIGCWRAEGMGVADIQDRQMKLMNGLEEIIEEIMESSSESSFMDQIQILIFFYRDLRCNVMIQKIFAGSLNIAYLITLETESNLLETDVQVNSMLLGYLSQEMQKVSYFMDNKGDVQASFLAGLLNDLPPNRKMLERSLKLMKCRLKEEMYIVVVRAQENHVKIVNLLLYQFQRILTNEMYTIYGNELVILLGRDVGAGIGDYTTETFRNIADRCHLRIGISRSFRDITNIRRYYDQAEKALNYGEIYYNMSNHHPLYYFHDYMLFELLEVYRRSEDPLDLCNPKLLKLIKYDSEHGTEYMYTLFWFMEYCNNVKTTADALYIHKNTLIYRMDKIKSIIESNLNDGWENFTIYLSFRILMFTGIYQPDWRVKLEDDFWKKQWDSDKNTKIEEHK